MTTAVVSPTFLVRLDGGLAARVRLTGGDPILWLHGYTLDSSTWDELWDHLPGWSHVGIDLPGHGASGPLAPGEGLRGLARRVGRLAVELGIHHLAALSFGTLLAIQIASELPEAFATLILGAPALAGGPRDEASRLRYRELAQRYREQGPGPHLRTLWMQSPPDIFKHAERRPELWGRLWEAIGRHRWSELGDGSLLRLLSQQQGEAELRRIEAATLVLVGQHELPAFELCAQLIQSVVTGCRREEIPTVGHLCMLEAPAAVGALIDEHLAARRGATQGRASA